jgi:hypothetical protein
MKVRFFTFEQYHGKNGIGSTRLRVHNLIDKWKEAELYKYGEQVDVMIFQKVYMQADFKLHRHAKYKKILDICDPEWLEKQAIKETIDNVDAVTCSSEALKNFIEQLTDKPVVHIPDRFNLDIIGLPKKHTGRLKKLVWFGYKQNVELLKSAIPYLEKNNLSLTIISNEDPMMSGYKYTFIKYDEETIYKELKKNDVCILPDGFRPIDMFKSNNKRIKAHLAGLPVVTTSEEIEQCIEAKARESISKICYDKCIVKYDCNLSIEQYKKLIKEL